LNSLIWAGLLKSAEVLLLFLVMGVLCHFVCRHSSRRFGDRGTAPSIVGIFHLSFLLHCHPHNFPPKRPKRLQVDGVSVVGASADWFTDAILGFPGACACDFATLWC